MIMTAENPSTRSNIRPSVTSSTTYLTRIGPGLNPESRDKSSTITRATWRFKHQPSSKRHRKNNFLPYRGQTASLLRRMIS